MPEKRLKMTLWTFAWTLSVVKSIPRIIKITIRISEKMLGIPQIVKGGDPRKTFQNTARYQSMCNRLILNVLSSQKLFTFKVLSYFLYKFTFLFVEKITRNALAPVHPPLRRLPILKKMNAYLMKVLRWRMTSLTRPSLIKGNHQEILKERGHRED